MCDDSPYVLHEHCGLVPLDRARAEDQHAVSALAAQHLLPGVGGHVHLDPGRDARRSVVGGQVVCVLHTQQLVCELRCGGRGV